MPKSKPALTLNLNLLKPQSNPEKLPVKLISWLFSSGRYIFIAVNALVLIALVARFKFDADLAAKNEAIAEQIPYIESLKSYELLIRDTQLKLLTIDTIKTNALDWQLVLKKIADQIPTSITLSGINIDMNIGRANIHISGQTSFNSDIADFIAGLKMDSAFSDVNLSSISLEQDTIKFAIDASAKPTASGGSKL
ncbi:MAG: PilN domain-containing protein [Candidatus Daviesbacteria bacterium]|nr:PilN domain-containing protein [Candidatus Daviesbacteria bacterium]